MELSNTAYVENYLKKSFQFGWISLFAIYLIKMNLREKLKAGHF